MSDSAHDHADGSTCAAAHGDGPAPDVPARELVAVYASPVASYLLAWGRELGFRTVLLEPDPGRVTRAHRSGADLVLHDPTNVEVTASTDVVVTDHHRDDLGEVMAPLVLATPRWIGIMGSPRHAGPHIEALRARDVPEEEIAQVHRPIGLNIGSQTPAEIALSTLAGLVADRTGRPGGFPTPAAATGTS